MDSFPGKIFLYGPPGSGKTVTGKLLARALGLPFCDLDHTIEKESGLTIAEIFAGQGEAAFRERERRALESALDGKKEVVALGGGALLDPENRARAEAAGLVICLTASFPALLSRVVQAAGKRPLLTGGSLPRPHGQSPDAEGDFLASKLANLLERRAAHYASFPRRVDTSGLTPEGAAWEAQIRLGWFRVKNMAGGPGYEVIVYRSGLGAVGAAFAGAGAGDTAVLVSDDQVAPRYAPAVIASLRKSGWRVELITFPAGEAEKTPLNLEMLWARFVEAGLDRGSQVVALGGGVVSDLAGFAAATFLRGISWFVLPTTLLAMCDAAIGGKTGADLPQGKNLVGAFHPPRLVLADPEALGTLPERELRSGLAEVVKAGVIGDPALYALCAGGMEAIASRWDEAISRAVAVKVRVIEADPFEKGLRAILNLGHTVGHAVEWASVEGAAASPRIELKHGEAVAIGMIVEARLAEKIGLAEAGLAEQLKSVLGRIGLPVAIPAGYPVERILSGMKVDKKRSRGQIRFALPVKIGEVQPGIIVEEEQICDLISSCTAQT